MDTKTKEAPLTREVLTQYFLDGCKKLNDLKIGVEWEKIGVYQESGKAIAYSGPRGVEAILKSLVEKYSWEPIYSDSHIIALKKNESSITLEPGGQIELSGHKAVFLDENAAELNNHLSEIKEVSKEMGIVWLGIGMQPISALDEIEWVPKERYQIMREALKNKGELTYSMMKQTASIQVSIDYINESDAIEKLRLAMALSPILSAIFSNSPISEGKLNGFYSKRGIIWSKTDPDRTGVLYDVFKKDFGFSDYTDYALSVPMFFIVREGRWIPVKNLTFKDYLQKGMPGYLPTLSDWELHLTTIFTDARLKKYLEIRSIDCQNKTIGLAVPALIKGLFYDEITRNKAWGLVKDLTLEERRKLRQEGVLKGLKTPFPGHKTLLDLAGELLKLGEEGLNRLSDNGLAKKGEAAYLAPLKELLFAKGSTPADTLITCFENAKTPEEKLEKILTCSAL